MLNDELALLCTEEPEGITRLLLALRQGTIRGAIQGPPTYYQCGPYGHIMGGNPIIAQNKTFEMRTWIAIRTKREWERTLTPLEYAVMEFVEGEVTSAHQTLYEQIVQIQESCKVA